jgi:class 3 adenylate cyclase
LLLLETVYGSINALAKRCGVFKVETFGDCNVAVCGVPKAQKHHAVIRARFARATLSTMSVLTWELEIAVGPDTADLAFHIGLHSVTITGGVLHGDNARFQLYGDSMKTASRIESTGTRDRVHISKRTADLLITAGKTHLINRRDQQIVAKGLGEFETFWLVFVKERGDGPSLAGDTDSIKLDVAKSNLLSPSPHKTIRLIKWNVEVLLRLLK